MTSRTLRATAAAAAVMMASIAFAQPAVPRRTTPTYETALFEHSLLEASRAQARLALRGNPRNVDALFVEMEAAALEVDTPSVLDAALRILAIPSAQQDQRAAIAAARVYDLAANTREFVKVLPRVQALVTHDHAQAEVLRAALVKAGMDGARAVNVAAETKAAGILTDWRAAGPFGEYANLDFNRAWPPQRDLLMGSASDGQQVELFHFDDGTFRLPGYFGHDGVFYAMSRVEVGGGAFDLRVESAGTLEVFVDGKAVLRHDSRFREMPEVAHATVHLERGAHTVLVKFLNTAEPFRVALAKRSAVRTNVAAGAIDAPYVAASAKFWEGDYAGAVSAFEQLRSEHESAAVDWMLYKSWARAEKDSPETATLLDAVLRLTPEALAADYELAARDTAAGRLDDALQHLSRVLGRRAYFAPAEDLMGKIAVRMHLPVRASRSIEILLDIHPSCDVLRRAQHFFVGQARYDRARQIDEGLSECGLDSIAYATSLSESGHHQQAAKAAQDVVARNPLDRDARQMLARELALSGDTDAARAAIQALAKIAPNSQRFRRMAADNADPLTLLDSPASVAAAADSKAFYAPYRRDGIDVVKEAANRHFSGGPALLLLDDQVARQWPDGSVSLYVHRITRALDRGGVELYGEVSVPTDAQVLELRTIRADGSVVEPELTPEKATVSMPGFLPGDAIDEEYLFHYTAADANFATAFTHKFGSFRAPILASDFVALTPDGIKDSVQASSTAPTMNESLNSGIRVREWKMKDIAQAVEETASASGDILPTVRLTPSLERGWEDVRDNMREVAVDAERIGPRVTAAVAGMNAASDDQLARALYRQVTTTVRSTTSDFDSETPTAEQTLLNHEGSRTAALLAMANATGLQADLVLAREAGVVTAGADPAQGVYTRPLVRFHLRDSLGVHDVVVDAETDGLPFGMLPPSIDRSDALLVTLPENTRDAKVEPAILRLPARSERDQSVARADVTIGPNGDLSADLTILVGAWRGVQMRETLADNGGRAAFFERLARRIFPGADNVTGEVRNEDNPDLALEINIHCTAPQAIDLSHGTADLEQLVPDLGLNEIYPSVTGRKFPLFVSSPLFETTTFRIHLPENVQIVRRPQNFRADGQFGVYSVSFSEPRPGVLEIKRSFDVPVQVIEPGKLTAFENFESQIERAEQQRIGLAIDRTVARVGQ